MAPPLWFRRAIRLAAPRPNWLSGRALREGGPTNVTPINADAVTALTDEPVDWRFKGLPPSWAGRTPKQICADRPVLFDDGPTGPVCVLSAGALTHNLTTMADWCRDAGVEIAPHGKTHMAPQLFARQPDAGACGITAATISQVRVCRAFGVRNVILANQLVDEGGLRWLASELDRDPGFSFVCWVDSVRSVQTMAAKLPMASASRPVDACVEVGMAGGRTGCRTMAEVDDVLVTAGGSTYFDLVAEVLAGLGVRTVIRSGAYLTHDHGPYQRTSPLTRRGRGGEELSRPVDRRVTRLDPHLLISRRVVR